MDRSNTFITQRNGLIAGLLLWLVITIISVGVQQVNHVNNEKIAAQRTSEVTFWLIIAGRADGNAPTVENQLGLDLRAIKGDDAALRSFRGDANSYGGITDAIGYSPFHSDDCNECGPLTDEMVRNIELVDQGKVNVVIGRIDTDIDTSGFELSSVGPMWFNLLVGYLVIGLVAFSVGRLLEGPNFPEDYPAVYFISPPGAFCMKVQEMSRSNASERAKRKAFPEYMDLIDRANRTLASMPPGEDRDKLVDQRDRIAAEVDEQMSKSARNRSSDELAALQVEMEVTTTFLDDVDSAENSL